MRRSSSSAAPSYERTGDRFERPLRCPAALPGLLPLVTAPGEARVERAVFVVDDDEAMRDSLTWLLEGNGYTMRTYRSAEEFLVDDKRGVLQLFLKNLLLHIKIHLLDEIFYTPLFNPLHTIFHRYKYVLKYLNYTWYLK